MVRKDVEEQTHIYIEDFPPFATPSYTDLKQQTPTQEGCLLCLSNNWTGPEVPRAPSSPPWRWASCGWPIPPVKPGFGIHPL